MTPDRNVLLAAGETMAAIAPETGVPLQAAERFRIDVGGAESNVAMHVAAAGRPARWFSRLGDDELGRRVLARLDRARVDVSDVVIDPAHQTGVYLKSPGRGVYYYRRDSAASHLSPRDAAGVDLSDVAVLHVSGITPALSQTASDFFDALTERARAEGVLVSFDVNHRAALWSIADAGVRLSDCVERADIAFVGRDEAEMLWGLPDATSIRARFPSVPELIVKDADIGATSFTTDGRVFVAAPHVEVVEPVGAGDAFAGGYLAARLAGAGMADRLQAGHDRAAAVLTTTADVVDEVKDAS